MMLASSGRPNLVLVPTRLVLTRLDEARSRFLVYATTSSPLYAMTSLSIVQWH